MVSDPWNKNSYMAKIFLFLFFIFYYYFVLEKKKLVWRVRRRPFLQLADAQSAGLVRRGPPPEIAAIFCTFFLEIKQDITSVLQILWKNFRRVRKFPQANTFCGNQMKDSHCFVVIFTARFPQTQEFQNIQKSAEMNVYLSTLLCHACVGKIPQSLTFLWMAFAPFFTFFRSVAPLLLRFGSEGALKIFSQRMKDSVNKLQKCL